MSAPDAAWSSPWLDPDDEKKRLKEQMTGKGKHFVVNETIMSACAKVMDWDYKTILLSSLPLKITAWFHRWTPILIWNDQPAERDITSGSGVHLQTCTLSPHFSTILTFTSMCMCMLVFKICTQIMWKRLF